MNSTKTEVITFGPKHLRVSLSGPVVTLDGFVLACSTRILDQDVPFNSDVKQGSKYNYFISVILQNEEYHFPKQCCKTGPSINHILVGLMQCHFSWMSTQCISFFQNAKRDRNTRLPSLAHYKIRKWSKVIFILLITITLPLVAAVPFFLKYHIVSYNTTWSSHSQNAGCLFAGLQWETQNLVFKMYPCILLMFHVYFLCWCLLKFC